MSVNFGSSANVIQTFPGGWSSFLSGTLSKNLQSQIQYADDGKITTVWVYDGVSDVRVAIMWGSNGSPTTVPDEITGQGYAQATNNSDYSTFWSTYATNANQQQVFPVVLSGSISDVTLLSGSITGLLVGGVAVSQANPIPITGSISVVPSGVQVVTGSVIVANQVNVTGSVGITSPVTVNQGTNPWVVSGSGAFQVTGSVLVANQVNVTGTVGIASLVSVTGSVGITGPVTVQSGSVIGLLVGGQAVSNSNPVPVTGSVGVSGNVTVTGSVGITGPITGTVAIASAVAVTQGTTPWIVSGSNWTQTITGSVLVSNTVNVVDQSGSVVGLLVGGQAVNRANPVPVEIDAVPINLFVTASVSMLPLTTVIQYSGSTNPWIVSGSNWIPTVTGSVVLAAAPQIASGSVTGLLVGGQPVNFANPVPVTGTISITPSGVQVITGSVVVANTVQVTGSVGITGPITGTVGLSGPITGTVGLSGPITGSVSITSAVAVTQGTTPWAVSGSSVFQVTGSVIVANQVNVTGSVGITGPITGSVVLAQAPQIASGSVTGLLVGGQPASKTNPVPVEIDSVPINVFVTASVAMLPLTTVIQYSGSTNPWIVTGSVGISSGIPVGLTGAGAPTQALQVGGVDASGNLQPVATDFFGQQMVGDFAYAAVAGRIPSGLGGAIFSFSNTAGTGQLNATVYNEPSGSQRKISVSSANGADNVSGSGAQQITFTYYDGNMNGPFTEVLGLSGSVAVNTVGTNYKFIEKVVVSRAGSGGANAGIVTIFNAANGASGTLGQIGFANQQTGVGDAQTFWGQHYVRPGKTAYILGMSWDMDGVTSAVIYIKSYNPLATGPVSLQISPEFGTRYVAGAYSFRVPVVVQGPAHISTFCDAGGGVYVGASFEFVEF